MSDSDKHPSNGQTDRLFSNPLGDVAGFRFDKSVVDVFPDMIKRSVPGYETIIAMTGTLAGLYAQSNSRCYDLGCSLGASSLAMKAELSGRNCTIVAIDNSPAMIQRCSQLLDTDSDDPAIELIEAAIEDVDIEDASVVVLNFTLQFIAPEKRSALLHKISAGLRPGGILILSEKVAFAHRTHHNLMIELHHNFKRANGYSDLEISQKRTALEDVLIPETLDTHKHRLLDAGFSSIDVWFQCFNFASMLAIK
ncbi:MAG: carboxy-S-adenosyl-L-methionine synthase CmoA [bacterium]